VRGAAAPPRAWPGEGAAGTAAGSTRRAVGSGARGRSEESGAGPPRRAEPRPGARSGPPPPRRPAARGATANTRNFRSSAGLKAPSLPSLLCPIRTSDPLSAPISKWGEGGEHPRTFLFPLSPFAGASSSCSPAPGAAPSPFSQRSKRDTELACRSFHPISASACRFHASLS